MYEKGGGGMYEKRGGGGMYEKRGGGGMYEKRGGGGMYEKRGGGGMYEKRGGGSGTQKSVYRKMGQINISVCECLPTHQPLTWGCGCPFVHWAGLLRTWMIVAVDMFYKQKEEGGGGLEPKSLCTKNSPNQYFLL